MKRSLFTFIAVLKSGWMSLRNVPRSDSTGMACERRKDCVFLKSARWNNRQTLQELKEVNRRLEKLIQEGLEKKKNESQRLELLKEQIARAEAEKGVARLRILDEATAALNESLDVDTMLKSFSAIVTKNFADWCLVDMQREDSGSIDRQAEVYRDPLLEAMATEYRRERDLLLKPEILQTMSEGRGRIYVPPVERKDLLSSAIIIPLRFRDNSFGAVTFVSTDSEKIFTAFDLSTGEDLGKRCSFAVINAQLYNKANEASRAKSAFLANISHEIRTPLGAILGYAELAMSEVKLPDLRLGHVSAIVRNGQHLLRIVDEILDISKIESEQIQIEKVRFSLPKLLEDVLAFAKIKALEKGLNLIVNLPPEIRVQAMSDPTRLKQILLNVIGNAVKFTKKGHVLVDVQLEPLDSSMNKHLLKVCVEDTGVGIPARVAGNLFQPFVQADGSMTRKFGGTGLGLFLSKKLARLLNGDLVLKKSRYGKGSVFFVSIELENIEPEELESFQDYVVPEATSISANTVMTGRVLVVDDSKDNQILVAHYLSKMGLSYEVAENGREAVDRALCGNFDVILMDIQMPEMDGIQAMQFLRKNNYIKPIIAVTAHTMKGDRERYIDAGFDAYLSKPLSKDCLRRSLAENLMAETKKTHAKNFNNSQAVINFC